MRMWPALPLVLVLVSIGVLIFSVEAIGQTMAPWFWWYEAPTIPSYTRCSEPHAVQLQSDTFIIGCYDTTTGNTLDCHFDWQGYFSTDGITDLDQLLYWQGGHAHARTGQVVNTTGGIYSDLSPATTRKATTWLRRWLQNAARRRRPVRIALRTVVAAPAASALLLAVVASAQEPPPPVFDNLQVQASCTLDPVSNAYRYEYYVTNPAGNTVQMWTIDLTLGTALSSLVDTIAPAGWSSSTIAATESNLSPHHPLIDWCPSDTMANPPNPGTTSGPFAFSAPVPPAIQECWINPWLHVYFQAYLQATGEDGWDPDEQIRVELSYIRKLQTLGPLGVRPGSFQHWDTFIADVGRAGQLGWVSDATLLSAIQSNLTAARQAAVAQDAATTNAKLQAVIDAIRASTPSQRSNEGYALVLDNATYLQSATPWPCEPKLTVVPPSATHALGETHTATATLVNVATGLGIANNAVDFAVTEGPHAGLSSQTQSDANGKAAFSYVGTKTGTDTIIAQTPWMTPNARTAGTADCYAFNTAADPVQVTWEGGPNLRVAVFVPPVLISAPGRPFYVTETTVNTGNLPAGPSVTRYYLAATKPVDPTTAVVVGEHRVPALASGDRSAVDGLPFVVPASLPPGTE